MRLINTRTLVLEEYFGHKIPKYAILSHTWEDGEEVSYQDWQSSFHELANKKGFQKIKDACHMARRRSMSHLWVDTNCINKDSSAELSEAINSMFTWYERSSMCLVYLNDFNFSPNNGLAGFGASRWFTRGWTLQELLAPWNIQFFDASWKQFGTKKSLLLEISKLTSIHMQYLLHPDSIRLASVARRMSWVATRSTTRAEDMAYCLLGIFEINMPLLYGEGSKAFIRLQEEIIRHSNDHTIFCWSWGAEIAPDWHGCLAPRPIAFRDSGEIIRTGDVGVYAPPDFQLTNSGLRIDLPLIDCLIGGYKLAVLNASDQSNGASQMCICLQPSRGNILACSNFQDRLLSIPRSWVKSSTHIYLAHERDPDREFSTIFTPGSIKSFHHYGSSRYAILPILSAHENRFSIISEYDYTLSSMYGPILAFEQDDEQMYGEGSKQDNKESLWVAEMGFKTSENETFLERYGTIFTARINEAENESWDTAMQIRCERDRFLLEDDEAHPLTTIPLQAEFALRRRSGSMLLRLILISKSDLLDGIARCPS